MNINIFLDYLVTVHCRYSYVNEDRDFKEEEFETERVVTGGKLMEEIAKHMLDVDAINIDVFYDEIAIDMFNPNSGETARYIYTFTVIKKEV